MVVIRDVFRRKGTLGPETISVLHRGCEMQMALLCVGAAGSGATRLGLFDRILLPVFLFYPNIPASFLQLILKSRHYIAVKYYAGVLCSPSFLS